MGYGPDGRQKRRSIYGDTRVEVQQVVESAPDMRFLSLGLRTEAPKDLRRCRTRVPPRTTEPNLLQRVEIAVVAADIDDSV